MQLLALVTLPEATANLSVFVGLPRTASALLGTLQMLTGAVMMGLAGLFTDGRPLPMVIGMTAGPLIALVLTWGTLGLRPARPCPAA